MTAPIDPAICDHEFEEVTVEVTSYEGLVDSFAYTYRKCERCGTLEPDPTPAPGIDAGALEIVDSVARAWAKVRDGVTIAKSSNDENCEATGRSRGSGTIYRRRLAALDRRVAFLAARVANYTGSNDSRDRAELAALRWAIRVIQANPATAWGVL